VLDLETTGLSPSFDEIIEAAAIRVRNGIEVARYEQLINPGRPVGGFITGLTGITDAMLVSRPSFDDVATSLWEFIGNDVIVGHSIAFDRNFLYDHMLPLGYQVVNNTVDTMRIGKRVFPGERHYRLDDLVERTGVTLEVPRHRALGDVLITQAVYNSMCVMASANPTILERVTRPKTKTRTRTSQLKTSDIVAIEDVDEDNPLFGFTFCFTGTLERMVRKEAWQLVVNCGGILDQTVTRETNYLVMGETDYSRTVAGQESSKTLKARRLQQSGSDIHLIPETVFYDMLAEAGIGA